MRALGKPQFTQPSGPPAQRGEETFENAPRVVEKGKVGPGAGVYADMADRAACGKDIQGDPGLAGRSADGKDAKDLKT